MKAVHTGCLRRTDIQNATDRLFQQGLAVVPGMSAQVVATALDESLTLVEAWASPRRNNHFPAWALAHPRFPGALRVFMEAGLRALASADPCAASPEDHHHSTLGAFGDMLGVCARAMAGDNAYTPAEAREALAPATRAARLLGTFIEHLQRRAGVVASGDA